MIGTSTAFVVAGATVAWIVARHPRHREVIEMIGGSLLIAGFALLGYSLECVFGRP
jgi:cytochrome c biogenesis protein CcdA